MIKTNIRQARIRRWILLGVLATAVVPSVAYATNYVALGDSYTAGQLIPQQVTKYVPVGCFQSNNSYPHLTAAFARAGNNFNDVACSGATTYDMTGTQDTSEGSNPPQFDALKKNTGLVSVGIGGNDLGFISVLIACATNSPIGHPCRDRFVKNGVDSLAQRITSLAPRIASGLQTIHAKSPEAKVLLVGYPDVLPNDGSSCFSQIPITRDDIEYLNSVEQHFNSMLQTEAEQNNAIFVDTYDVTVGHDACRSASQRWIEPVVPASPAAPGHPNAKGQQAMALEMLLAITER